LLLAPLLVVAAILLFPRLVVPEGVAAAVHFAAGTGAALLALVAAARSVREPGSVRFAVALGAFGLVLVGLAALAAPWPWVAVVLVDLGLVAVAHAAGGAIGVRVAHPGHLLPACAVAAAADLASVIHPSGPSHAIAGSERAISLLAIGFPVPGTRAVAPVLGAGDLVFLALVFGVVGRHRLSLARATAAAVVGLAAAGALSACFEREIPALVPLGVAVVAALPEARRVRPEERRTAALAVAVAVAVVAGVLLSPR
jgi:hypothetical protein